MRTWQEQRPGSIQETLGSLPQDGEMASPTAQTPPRANALQAASVEQIFQDASMFFRFRKDSSKYVEAQADNWAEKDKD
eukprot:4267796-Prorocentrum_lima.AAC.1